MTATERRDATLLDLVGNTPLLRLAKVTADLPAGVTIHAKAEMRNPGGSVKDRPGLAMIRDGIARGLLTPDKTILDATSGNTGIAYAMVAAALGYRVELCLPRNASEERKRILRAYGATLVLTDPAEGSDGAIREARRRYAADPDRYFYPDQYNNDANWRAHYLTTGPEIWEQTGGAVTHFVAGLGTSGTFMGTGRRLREYNPGIRLIAMQPDGPFHGLEGLKHMATAIVPGIYDPDFADEIVTVSTEEAHAMVKRLAREEGLMAGISAAANVVASLKVAERLTAGTIVTILCDGADKYLSERFWDEES
ncbi:MAG TPA: cysteine synthase family protein [Thermomicrobiales bacterium]|nr:cysteine synthase family protein [Thermomicrobiales bacterium]